MEKLFGSKGVIVPLGTVRPHADELYIEVRKDDFRKTCLAVHKKLVSPVMMFFAADETLEKKSFRLFCVFEDTAERRWVFVVTDVPSAAPEYETLSKEIFSASLFEREMKEMFGIVPLGNPDSRRLNLHDEVWPDGNFPLRKNFSKPSGSGVKDYVFRKVQGEGIFEIPVGPVHAGIIGPGHFRFSAAGEPVISLEPRLGFTHRGVEKLFENRAPGESAGLAECVSGDTSFAHSLAFCRAAEKAFCAPVPAKTEYMRAIFLELERMYNHAGTIGGIAVDVGFSFPNAYASAIKESLLCLNEKLTGSRYLKGINVPGGIAPGAADIDLTELMEGVKGALKDETALKEMLLSSISFMDRVDGTGILEKEIAEDTGIVGLVARASGIQRDLRSDFPGVYGGVCLKPAVRTAGDVMARLQVRLEEFETSAGMIEHFCRSIPGGTGETVPVSRPSGYGLGYAEGCRGPVLYWMKLNGQGRIDRCKIVDPSFHNWQGLSYAVEGNIIPDFPLCNKSFDLSYAGNDL